MEQLKTQWSDQAPRYFSQLLTKLNEISAFTRSDDARRNLVINIVESLKAILDRAAGQLSDNDILAAAALNDISVIVTKFDMSIELHDDIPGDR